MNNEEAKKLRKKELIKKFNIIRGSKYSVAVKVRLNLEEEVEKVKEVVVTEVIDPKKKK
jgi:hypothetical protein